MRDGRARQQTLAKRGAQYANEVRRLLDAGLDVMRRCGTTSSPRVSDIVAAAGLSNDAFYRHFASKDALVAAIIEDGAARLASYLHHQMAKTSTPEMSVRRWVEGVMSQAADDDIAATTRAVLWNGGRISDRLGSSRPSHAASLASSYANHSLSSAAPTLRPQRRSLRTPPSACCPTSCGKVFSRREPRSTTSSSSASRPSRPVPWPPSSRSQLRNRRR